MNGWLVFLVLVGAYLGLLALLRRRAQPLPGGFEVNGPFVFWRTQLGKRGLQRIARAERFWNVVADVGIVATWITGAAIFALLLYQLSLYFTIPEVVAESATPPEFLIGLPGVNPLIPVWYGLAALVIALVVHEGAHGVMAFVGKMRVKSLGLLFFVVPVGAFVEPDEEDLEKSSVREKNRVFAAGPWSNLILATIAGVLLVAVMGSITLTNGGQGLGVGGVVADSPADNASLMAGDIVLEINDIPVRNATHFTEIMNGTRAGQRIDVDYLRDGATRETSVLLADRADYTLNETHRGKGFFGMGTVPLTTRDPTSTAARFLTPEGRLDVMTRPFGDGFPGSFAMGGGPGSDPGSFIVFISLPFATFITGMDVLASPYASFLEVTGPLASLPAGFVLGLATLLYWIVWINIMLGTFNALPAGPLDGGQMFRATLRDRLMKRYKVDAQQVHVERLDIGGLAVRGKDDATQQKLDRIHVLTKRATWTIGLFILVLIVLPLFGPQLLQLMI